MTRALLILLPLPLALAACDGGKDAKHSESGRFEMSLPGFKADVKVPGAIMGKSDFDIDGVRLPEGAQVTGVNVDANRDGGKGAVVVLSFSAPGAPAQVRDHFARAFADKGVAARTAGDGISGTSKDGNPFAMAFTDAGDGKTRGTITIDDKD